jgi:hypothetical protein
MRQVLLPKKFYLLFFKNFNFQLDYVKNLINEARQISKQEQYASFKANTNSSKSTKSTFDKKSSKDTEVRHGSSVISNEKVLLQSVEGLVSAIKSGKLIKEQELSDQRIQSILNRVIERKEIVGMFNDKNV